MFRISQYLRELAQAQATGTYPTSRERHARGPVVIWNLIRRCNLTCEHCYSISADKDFPGELNTQEVFKVMDDLKDARVPVPNAFQLYQGLRDQGFVSAAEIDRRTAQLHSAQAQLAQAQAQLSNQGNQAAYTQLLADVDGVVTGVDAEVDQVVSAGAPVVRVAQDGPRDVVFAVPEDRLNEVRPGQPVDVRRKL